MAAAEPNIVELAIKELIMERQDSHGASLSILEGRLDKEPEFTSFCQKLLTSIEVGQRD